MLFSRCPTTCASAASADRLACLTLALANQADASATRAARWEILYDHYVNTYIPCVESLGYSVEPPPSRDVYISKVLGGELPYSPAVEVGPQVMEDVERGLYESVDDFHRSVCPDTVNLDILYPPD